MSKSLDISFCYMFWILFCQIIKKKTPPYLFSSSSLLLSFSHHSRSGCPDWLNGNGVAVDRNNNTIDGHLSGSVALLPLYPHGLKANATLWHGCRATSRTYTCCEIKGMTGTRCPHGCCRLLIGESPCSLPFCVRHLPFTTFWARPRRWLT